MAAIRILTLADNGKRIRFQSIELTSNTISVGHVGVAWPAGFWVEIVSLCENSDLYIEAAHGVTLSCLDGRSTYLRNRQSARIYLKPDNTWEWELLSSGVLSELNLVDDGYIPIKDSRYRYGYRWGTLTADDIRETHNLEPGDGYIPNLWFTDTRVNTALLDGVNNTIVGEVINGISVVDAFSRLQNGISTLYSILNYAAPNITSLTVNGASPLVLEMGAGVINPTLLWTRTGATPDTQSIDGIGQIDPTLLTYVVDTGLTPIVANQTWTLRTSDVTPTNATVTDTATVSINFKRKVYWGVSTQTSLTDLEILNLSSNALANNGSRSVSYNCELPGGEGTYPYYVYPQDFDPLTIKVNGSNFSQVTSSTRSFTNESGHTSTYIILRFTYLQTGNPILVEFL